MGLWRNLSLIFIIIIGLAFVGFAIFSNTSSKIAWSIASPISVSDWQFNSEGESFLLLKNSASEDLILKKLVVNGDEMNFGAELPKKKEKIITLKQINCEENEAYSFDVKIYYNSSKGENILQEGIMPLEGQCNKETTDTKEYFSDLKTALVSLGNAVKEIPSGEELKNAKDYTPKEKWNKNFE